MIIKERFQTFIKSLSYEERHKKEVQRWLEKARERNIARIAVFFDTEDLFEHPVFVQDDNHMKYLLERDFLPLPLSYVIDVESGQHLTAYNFRKKFSADERTRTSTPCGTSSLG